MPFLTVTVAGVDRTAYLCGPSGGSPATFEEALRERKRFSCEFVSPDGSWAPLRGQGITVSHPELGYIFGGYVSNATRRNVPGKPAVFTNVTCVAYEHICRRRLSIARSWTGQLAGGIFHEIISESLIDEGFTVEFEAGPTIPYFEAMEPRPPVDVALDRLCELASGGGDKYYWDISAGKVARFFRQNTYDAPFNITDANPYVLGNSGEFAAVDETNQGLVNTVYVYLGQFLLDGATEEQLGDGGRTYEVTKPIGSTPYIGVDSLVQTVGVDGVDTGMDWYWTLGSSRIRQDDSAAPLTGSNTLSVTYQGLGRVALGPYTDDTSTNAEGVLQGDGTGIYETMLQIDQIGTASDADTLAQSHLDRYKQATVQFKAATLQWGLRAGQQIDINLTSLNINLTMLIESMTMTDIGRGTYLWSFTAIYGPARDDWKRALLGEKPSTSVTGIGASGTVGPEGPPGTAGGTAAPNVTATAAVFYEEWANSQRFGFQGTITLPTTDPDYSHLDRIEVMAVDPDGISHVLATFDIWGGGATLDYEGTIDEQPAAPETWAVQFICFNEAGVPSDFPYTVTGLVVSAAQVVTITAAEVAGAVYQDGQDGLHTVILVSLTVMTYPLVFTFWFDYDDGRGWVWQGWLRINSVGQTFRIGDAYEDSQGVKNAGTIWKPTDPDRTSWKVAGIAGAVLKTNTLPPGAVQSSFTVPAIAEAQHDDVSNIHFNPDPASGDLKVYSKTTAGIYTWHFYELQWDQPTLADAPHYWFSFLTVQRGHYASGDFVPSDDEEGSSPYADMYLGRKVTDTGAVQGGNSLEGTTVFIRGTSWPDWTYPANDSPDRIFRFRVYSVSRRGTDEAGGDGVITLNDGWPGVGSDHYDLLIPDHPETLNLKLADPATFRGFEKEPGTNKLQPKLAVPLQMLGDAISMVPGAIDDSFLADGAVHANHLAAAAVILGKLAAAAVEDVNVIDVGVTKLLHGTKIFTGNVFLSRGPSQPVLALTNSALGLFGVANSSGADGLTSQPHVLVQASGIAVLSGTGPSVVVSSSSITLYTVNGSLTSPYLALSSIGIQLKHTDFTVDLTAGNLRMAYTGSLGTADTVLNSGGLTVTNGDFQVKVGSSFIQLWSKAGNVNFPYVGIDAGHIYIGGGGVSGSLVTITSSSATIAGPVGNQIVLNNLGEAVFTYAGASTFITGDQLQNRVVRARQFEMLPGSDPSFAFQGVAYGSATAGASSALPALPLAYIRITMLSMPGSPIGKIPVFAN